MDETNPAYENFRNKMTAFGQPIRGTTRKVAASKFFGRDLAAAIEINARKIAKFDGLRGFSLFSLI